MIQKHHQNLMNMMNLMIFLFNLQTAMVLIIYISHTIAFFINKQSTWTQFFDSLCHYYWQGEWSSLVNLSNLLAAFHKSNSLNESMWSNDQKKKQTLSMNDGKSVQVTWTSWLQLNRNPNGIHRLLVISEGRSDFVSGVLNGSSE